MVYGPPTPATDAVKVLPEIPGPLKAPPAGDPVNVADAAPILYDTARPLNDTVGKGLITLETEVLPVHPFAFVTVTLKLPAVDTEIVCVVAPVDQL